MTPEALEMQRRYANAERRYAELMSDTDAFIEREKQVRKVALWIMAAGFAVAAVVALMGWQNA